MAYDEMELDLLGDRRTALFVIISDTDDTFNFVVSILNPAKSTASSSRTYPDLVVITLRWESIWNRFFP